MEQRRKLHPTSQKPTPTRLLLMTLQSSSASHHRPFLPLHRSSNEKGITGQSVQAVLFPGPRTLIKSSCYDLHDGGRDLVFFSPCCTCRCCLLLMPFTQSRRLLSPMSAPTSFFKPKPHIQRQNLQLAKVDSTAVSAAARQITTISDFVGDTGERTAWAKSHASSAVVGKLTFERFDWR